MASRLARKSAQDALNYIRELATKTPIHDQRAFALLKLATGAINLIIAEDPNDALLIQYIDQNYQAFIDACAQAPLKTIEAVPRYLTHTQNSNLRHTQTTAFNSFEAENKLTLPASDDLNMAKQWEKLNGSSRPQKIKKADARGRAILALLADIDTEDAPETVVVKDGREERSVDTITKNVKNESQLSGETAEKTIRRLAEWLKINLETGDATAISAAIARLETLLKREDLLNKSFNDETRVLNWAKSIMFG